VRGVRQWAFGHLSAAEALHLRSCSGEAQRPPESGGRGPIGQCEGRFLSKPCNDAALEPPLARSRLRLDRAALLTQEGAAPFLKALYSKPAEEGSSIQRHHV